jgi:hypothetical protein
LIHDLWGADGTQNSSAPYPGDNGNWASWDAYLTQWISDMNANDATAGLAVGKDNQLFDFPSLANQSGLFYVLHILSMYLHTALITLFALEIVLI